MGKPTEEEMNQAIKVAKLMREKDKDPYFLAKAFLNCHYQMTFLQAVLNAAEDYLHSGLSEREHVKLIKAIERAREVDDRGAHREPSSLGL